MLESEIRDSVAAAVPVQHGAVSDDRPRVGSWYVSTYPESGFVTGAVRRAHHRRRALEPAGPQSRDPQQRAVRERIRFDTAAQVVETLTERFGIDLTGLGDVEARVNEVLDS